MLLALIPGGVDPLIARLLTWSSSKAASSEIRYSPILPPGHWSHLAPSEQHPSTLSEIARFYGLLYIVLPSQETKEALRAELA